MSKIAGISFLLLMLCFGSHETWAQTDVSASAYGAFNSSTSSSGSRDVTTFNPSNSAGFLFEMRHIRNPLVGYEVTYSYNRANRAYSNTVPTPPCPVGADCGPITTTAAIPANAHEFTADWVASLKLANLRPFVLAGGGVLVNVPGAASVPATVTSCGTVNPLCQRNTTTISTSTQTTGVLVYGAGLDWTLLPHIGLRFQYRGNVYKASGLAQAFSSINSFTHNAEPAAGVFFRF